MRFFGGRRVLVQKPGLPVLREVPDHDSKRRMTQHQAEGDQPHDNQADEESLSGIMQHTPCILPPSGSLTKDENGPADPRPLLASSS